MHIKAHTAEWSLTVVRYLQCWNCGFQNTGIHSRGTIIIVLKVYLKVFIVQCAEIAQKEHGFLLIA